MDVIKSFWEGRERLWKAFWLVGVLGSIIVGIILYGVLVASLGLPFIIAWVVGLIYSIFAWVSIWRCGPNVQWIGWMWITRVLVILAIISTVLELFRGGQGPMM